MTSIESSTSLLEKYANLHTDMEQARTEASQCRSEMQTCQGQIQDLLEQRRIMQETTHQALHEQEILQEELDQQSRELESLQNDQALKRRHDHTHHVQTMIQRRHETTRKDYEQSLQNFQMACHQFLKGQILPRPLLPGDTSGRIMIDGKEPSSSFILGTSTTGRPIHHSVLQQDPSDHDKENLANNDNNNKNNLNGTSSCLSPNSNIMKIDWKVLFAQVLSTTNERVLQEVIQDLFPDPEQKTNEPSSDQESSLSMNLDHSPAKQETQTQNDVLLGEKTSDNADETTGSPEDESKETDVQGVQGIDNKRAGLSTSSSLLFAQCIQVIDKLLLVKTQLADQAQEKLAAMQAQYNQVMQDHDNVHKDHAQSLAKNTRQRSQKEQLTRQLDRLQNDIKRLHQQIDQVHSQTVELQQQESQTGPKRPKTRLSSDSHDHTPSKTLRASHVRNPYLQSANKSKRPRLHDSTETLVATDGPINHRSANKTSVSSAQPQAKHSSSSRRAIISPVAETSAHSTLTSATTAMSTNDSHDRVRDSSTRHIHRIGRVRGARDFGVSLSLESTSFTLPLDRDDSKDNPHSWKSMHSLDNKKAEILTTMTRTVAMDEMFSTQKPTTSSTNHRTTPIAEATTTTTPRNKPIVVSAAKGGHSPTRFLVRSRMHDTSSQDASFLSQESTTGSTRSGELHDDHDNDDPAFQFVFRK